MVGGNQKPVLKLRDMEEKHLHNLFLKNMSGLIEEARNPSMGENPWVICFANWDTHCIFARFCSFLQVTLSEKEKKYLKSSHFTIWNPLYFIRVAVSNYNLHKQDFSVIWLDLLGISRNTHQLKMWKIIKVSNRSGNEVGQCKYIYYWTILSINVYF